MAEAPRPNLPREESSNSNQFNPAIYLATSGIGRRIVKFKAKAILFPQGHLADFVLYLHSGRAKLSVVSKEGKEATVTLVTAGDFIGEDALIATATLRIASATAITPCVTMKIDRVEMLRALHSEHSFSDFFLKFVLSRSQRTQADLIDQLFNSSEKRLARTLLLLAEFGKPGEPHMLIPKISQQTLAEMIGTTRSRVSFFMNRFRKLGYIDYKQRILVNKSLLAVLLRDQLPEQNSSAPKLPNQS
jgi:CRP-like cAMP-binding protein